LDSSSATIRLADRAVAEATPTRVAGLRVHLPGNGSCFLAHRFRDHLAQTSYCHVRIRYRTTQQLGLLERFHQVLKEEDVYWRMYDNPGYCRTCSAEFHRRYNDIRPHRTLIPEAGGDVVTPTDVYTGKIKIRLPRWLG
jgi:transposase InsO family protein